LLAACSVLLLLAVVIRPLFPAGDASGDGPVAAAEADHTAYVLHPFAPERPAAVQAQVSAMVKRVDATGASGALVPAPQSTPVPVAYHVFADPAPEGGPLRGTAASPRLPTGPPRIQA
jgi:hypothetical protein